MIHVAIWKQEKMLVYSKKQAYVGVLLFDNVFIEVWAEYFNYSNVFLVEHIVKLPENTEMNKHAIILEKGKQLPFELIYSLGLVELQTLKIYTETKTSQ